MVEQIVDLAVALPGPDRALLDAVYREGIAATDLAGVRDEDPRVLRRRVRALVKRVMSPEFRYVAAATGRTRRCQNAARLGFADPTPTLASKWPRTRRRVAELCVLHGMSQRAAAEALGISNHVLRRHRDAITALYEESLL